LSPFDDVYRVGSGAEGPDIALAVVSPSEPTGLSRLAAGGLVRSATRAGSGSSRLGDDTDWGSEWGYRLLGVALANAVSQSVRGTLNVRAIDS